MIEIPAGLHVYQLTLDRIEALWAKVKDYDRLFSDETRGEKETWVRNLMDRKTIVLETDDYQAMFFLSNIQPGRRAEVHAIAFDHQLSLRTTLAQAAIVWAFVEFDLERIGASIPTASKALRRWMQKLGFVIEGTLRHDFQYGGRWVDSLLLGMLREETLWVGSTNR